MTVSEPTGRKDQAPASRECCGTGNRRGLACLCPRLPCIRVDNVTCGFPFVEVKGRYSNSLADSSGTSLRRDAKRCAIRNHRRHSRSSLKDCPTLRRETRCRIRTRLLPSNGWSSRWFSHWSVQWSSPWSNQQMTTLRRLLGELYDAVEPGREVEVVTVALAGCFVRLILSDVPMLDHQPSLMPMPCGNRSRDVRFTYMPSRRAGVVILTGVAVVRNRSGGSLLRVQRDAQRECPTFSGAS